jgi:hypothetical protein
LFILCLKQDKKIYEADLGGNGVGKDLDDVYSNAVRFRGRPGPEYQKPVSMYEEFDENR